MITQGRNDIKRGEYVETAILLVDDFSWHLNDKYMLFTNITGIPVLRFYMDGNQLKFDFYNFADSAWETGGTITPTDPSSARFPQTGSSYVLVEPTAIKGYIADQLEMLLTAGTLDLQGKTLTGLAASADIHSAVTLEQVQGIIAGDSTDTIVSADLHSRVKVFSTYVQFIVDTLEALHLKKQSTDTLELNVIGADTVTLKTSSDQIAFRLETSEGSARVLFAADRLDINKKAFYSFDTEADSLQDQDIVDLGTVKRQFVGKTADSDLDMNSHKVLNLQPATGSLEAVNLGQLPTHQYLYMFSSAALVPPSDSFYMQFQEQVHPEAFTPLVVQKAQQISASQVRLSAGIYRITSYLIAKYRQSTQTPISAVLEGAVSGDVPQSALQCSNTDDFARAIHNQRTFVVRLPAIDTFRLRITCVKDHTLEISSGCSLDIQLLQAL